MTAALTFFPVENGDMTLVTFDNGQTLLIDINVRQAADDDEDDTPDVMADLRSRLGRDSLGRLYVDGFLLSHPDMDHIRGLETHFHLGPPDEWSKKDNKILIREMWSSPIVFRRAGRDHVLGSDAKAWAQEARRRVALFRKIGAAVGEGDRIQIMGEDENGKTDDILAIVVKTDNLVTSLNGSVSGAFTARLLAPLPTGKDEKVEEVLAKNRSSVILRLSIRGGGILDKCRFLTGGDAGVAIWERIWDAHGKTHLDWLTYDILQTPHHCSWRSLSYDSYSELGEKAKVNESARSALGQTRKGAVIVASSKVIDANDADPPSDRAKREYISILGDKDRFICVADIWNAEQRALEYEIRADGIIKKVKNAAAAAAGALGVGATASEARGHG